jgi:hypothetical protein
VHDLAKTLKLDACQIALAPFLPVFLDTAGGVQTLGLQLAFPRE